MQLGRNILDIKREFGEFDKVRFIFRYFKVNKKEQLYIQNELSDLNLKINEVEDDIYIINFPLTKNVQPEIIRKINNKLNLMNNKFGISVSFTTEYDHAGFRLPKKIRDFYLIVSGEFDYSIIMI